MPAATDEGCIVTLRDPMGGEFSTGGIPPRRWQKG